MQKISYVDDAKCIPIATSCSYPRPTFSNKIGRGAGAFAWGRGGNMWGSFGLKQHMSQRKLPSTQSPKLSLHHQRRIRTTLRQSCSLCTAPRQHRAAEPLSTEIHTSILPYKQPFQGHLFADFTLLLSDGVLLYSPVVILRLLIYE